MQSLVKASKVLQSTLFIIVMGFWYNLGAYAMKYDDSLEQNNAVFNYRSGDQYLGPAHYDGGYGIDTLKIKISPEEYENPKFLADIIGFSYYLQNTLDISSKAGEGDTFQFSSWDVSIQNIEILEIEVIESATTKEIGLKEIE